MGPGSRFASQRNLLEESADLRLLPGEQIMNSEFIIWHVDEAYTCLIASVILLKVCVCKCCCFRVQGRHVIAGSSEGSLHVWDWEKNTEICHISAHKQRINHCSLLPNTGTETLLDPLFILNHIQSNLVPIFQLFLKFHL